SGPDNEFRQVSDSVFDLTPLTDPLAHGQIATGERTMNIPVTAGTRLLMVYTARPSPGNEYTIRAYVSGGLSISCGSRSTVTPPSAVADLVRPGCLGGDSAPRRGRRCR